MKLFKRVAAFALSCSLIFGSVPLDTAFANYQKYITNLTISYVPTTGFEYPISFNWTLPTTWSTLTDTSTEDGDVYHEPEGYRISRANTTAKESTYTVIDEVAQPDANSANIKESLVSGSIYAYRVIPYHRHTKAGASGASTKIDAPYESSVSLETVLFMTDIQVEAAGAGSELTVTWDNPQFQGANLFTGYRLYYQRGGEQVTTFNNYRDVVITDPDLISISDTSRSGVKRLRYTFSDPNIVQGEVYAVKVEPLYKNGEVRSVASGLSYGTVS
ncbi:MAG: hypothetical protein IJ583_03895, partial [Firmicutes bacterium]|nr:hypothetical protein [Bacillota bacterium]